MDAAWLARGAGAWAHLISTLAPRVKLPVSKSPSSAYGMAWGLGVGWCWGEKPESSPGQEAQCLAGFLGPAKEGAGALSYRGWLGEGRNSGEGGVGKSIEIGDSQQTGVHRLKPGRMTQGALGGGTW